jgi:hypothetical protein
MLALRHEGNGAEGHLACPQRTRGAGSLLLLFKARVKPAGVVRQATNISAVGQFEEN